MPGWDNTAPVFMMCRSYAQECFGDLNLLIHSDKHPTWLLDKLLADGKPIPDIYMACGESDGLLPNNRRFVEELVCRQVPVTFRVGPGGHEWDFWDTYIQKALDWLPIPQTGIGINSGHVGV